MTDITALAYRLYQRIEWQSVPETVAQDDLTTWISDGIRDLYVMTGRALSFSEDMFTMDGPVYAAFSEDLKLDEIEYVLATAEIMFYGKVQTTVNELVSYTTDAMSVAHGDKPFANLQQTIDDARKRQRMYWYKMIRYHML